MDTWFQHLGKEVTLVRQTPTEGGGIDTANYYRESVGASRKIKGKIVGTNGVGLAVIKFDKPFKSDRHTRTYSNFPNLSHVAMEYREEVEAARGENQFLTLSTGYEQMIKIGEFTGPAESKSDKTTKVEAKAATKEEKAQSFFGMLKEDGQDATFRVVSAKFAEGVRNLLAIGIASQLGESATSEAIQAVLSTPVGTAAVQAVAGYGLTYAPKRISSDARVKKLAKEFRVASMATVGGVAIDTIMPQITNLIDSAIAMLPSEEDSKVRVTEDSKESSNVFELAQAEEEAETQESEAKKMAANSR